MEGTVAPGQDAYSSFLIDRIAGLSTVTKEEKKLLEIYIRLAYGGAEPTLTIPFYLAKGHGLFPSSIVMAELVAEGEYWERREEFREKCRADMRERLERLRYSIRCDEEYIAEYDRTHKHVEDILPKSKEYKERERYLARNREERDDLEHNYETKLEESVQNFNDSVDYLLLREEIAPRDFTTRTDPAEKDKVMRACIKELGTAGQRALQIIREFVNFCTLLAEHENHITKKSGQHVAKQVNTRTEADMTNEMVRNLTALPKYTAYAKVLEDEGRKVWKGKIRTRDFRATNDQKADTSETWSYIQLRRLIPLAPALPTFGDNGPLEPVFSPPPTRC